MHEILPVSPGVAPEPENPPVPQTAAYRPWSRGRVWVLFMFGMHAAGCMTFFFHPVFAFFGLAFGLPAVILSGIEIREFPEARHSGPVRWGRITGLIGVIGGPICMVLFGLIIAAVFSAF